MKILLLAGEAVGGYYTASLLERGHGPIILHGGGAPLFDNPATFKSARQRYMECDACLLVSDEPEMLEIADHFADTGKPLWRDLADVPRVEPSSRS